MTATAQPDRPAPSNADRAGLPAALPQQSTRRLDSQQLMGAAQEVEIAHDGAVYRLRRTALGKLILTK